jgi:hypothetical protein
MFVGIKGSINTWRKGYGEQMLRGLWVLAACFDVMSPSIRFQVKIFMTFQPHGA